MFILLLFVRSTFCEVLQPHVVYILADDLGWNEVSWNNPGFLTPNLERLASNGVLLNQSYVSPKCSPSRAALLSGLYPWRLGMQRGAIGEISHTTLPIKSFLMGLSSTGRFRPTGLDPKIPLLPQILQDEGYATHMVKEDPQKLFFSCTRWVNGTWDFVMHPTCRPTEGSNPFLDNCPRCFFWVK